MGGSMRRRSIGVAALVGLGCLTLAPASHADSDTVSFTRIDVLGGAGAYFPETCPDVLIPPAGDCVDHYLIFYNDAAVEDGGPVPRHSSPWSVYVETSRLTYDGIHPDFVDITTLRSGFVEVPEDALEVDTARLSTASLQVSIPMDDGTVYDFQGTWRATGDRQHYGNDGPDLSPTPVHYNDRCVTTNNHAHQDFRWAEMTGTLNGRPVHSYTFVPDAAWIFDGHWKFQDVNHGGCTP
jgi:hypothetical protein